VAVDGGNVGGDEGTSGWRRRGPLVFDDDSEDPEEPESMTWVHQLGLAIIVGLLFGLLLRFGACSLDW